MPEGKEKRIVIVGGGTAGISIAARLRKALPATEIALVEPSDKHYYQPLWTLVGAGVFEPSSSARDELTCIPPGVYWLKERVVKFEPDNNEVITDTGKRLCYSILVVAPGIQINWNGIKGLAEAIGKDGVCSNYSFEYVSSTWQSISTFKGGTAIFTQPATPVKCAGAPQKIAYLAEDYFRLHNVRDKSRIIFSSAQPKIFSVERYAQSLEKVIRRKRIETLFKHNLVELRPRTREAVFENLDTKELITEKYDMIHVTPPMGPPDFVKDSQLADSSGWVETDINTLQHKRYKNVFSLGDAANLPTSKTGAAIRKQAPVAVANILSVLGQKEPEAKYDGYTSCPLVTGYKQLILAEFDYALKPQETFPFDQSKERYSMYLLKKHVLPVMYWEGMLKGRL